MRIALSGASGLIGSALTRSLRAAGHRCHPLVRRSPVHPGEIEWRPERGLVDPGAEGLDCLIHLAGENVGAGRWTAARKRRIRDSRGPATRRLVESLGALQSPPRVLLSASAIGWYGDRGERELDETASPGTGFLAEVCRDWEDAALGAEGICERVVTLRFAVVLASHGGALARMLTPFRLGFGGRLGSGRQYFPWVHLDDAVAAVERLLVLDVQGPVNVAAPEQVTNADLTRSLADATGRPAMLPAPAAALRLAFGEMARETLLASTRIVPAVLSRKGFVFRHPTLAGALESELASPTSGL